MFYKVLLIIFFISSQIIFSQTNPKIKTIKLVGFVTPNEKLTYKMLPFVVPLKTGKIEVSYDFTGKGNEIEIGLHDSNGFRGTSRFSKKEFEVGKYEATASYFPGAMPEGIWIILLAFPTIKENSNYEITVRIIPENHSEFTGSSKKIFSKEKKWYVGDFHTHTGHSDGFGCKDTEGKRTPCQVYQVAKAAHEFGLDFVSIADHNTISHYQDMRVLQPIYPNMLLIRGQEVTTYFGHANVFGLGIPIDYKFGFNNYSADKLQDSVEKLGGLLSINHPGRETGATCTGCGWNEPTTDFSELNVIEVINGTNVETKDSGIPFWHNLLNTGNRVIGIGGSDDHGAGSGKAKPGTPSTMVFSENLSEFELIEALKKGKVYIKTRSSGGSEIDFYATLGNKRWEMGENIPENILKSGNITFHIIRTKNENETIEIIENGQILSAKGENNFIKDGLSYFKFNYTSKGKNWIRINIRDELGIVILSNPIFLGWK